MKSDKFKADIKSAPRERLDEIWNNTLSKETTVILNSIITCPTCGFKKEEIMPTDACQYFYECENCKTLLKPSKVIVVSFVLMGQ